MAHKGMTLRQGDTDTMTFRVTTAETGGEYLEVEAVYASMRDVRPPVHCHPHQDEHFEILDGELTFEVEGERRVLGPGESIDTARGTYHTVWNDSDAPTRFIWRTTPALKTEKMFETLWTLADSGRMGRHGSPRPGFLQTAALMVGYRREYKLAAPDPRIAVPVCAAMLPLAYCTGHRSAITPQVAHT